MSPVDQTVITKINLAVTRLVERHIRDTDRTDTVSTVVTAVSRPTTYRLVPRSTTGRSIHHPGKGGDRLRYMCTSKNVATLGSLRGGTGIDRGPLATAGIAMENQVIMTTIIIIPDPAIRDTIIMKSHTAMGRHPPIAGSRPTLMLNIAVTLIEANPDIRITIVLPMILMTRRLEDTVTEGKIITMTTVIVAK